MIFEFAKLHWEVDQPVSSSNALSRLLFLLLNDRAGPSVPVHINWGQLVGG